MMINVDDLPQPADSAADVAIFFTAGPRALPGPLSSCIAYEVKRDFLSAPREFVVLDVGADAWLVTETESEDDSEYGVFEYPDSEALHAEQESGRHLIFCWPDRRLELVCYSLQLVRREYHRASAAEALQAWLQSTG